MSISPEQRENIQSFLNSLPVEFSDEPVLGPIFCGTVADPKAVFDLSHDLVTAKIKHLDILKDEMLTYSKVMAPPVLTMHVRKHYGKLYKELKEILRQEYLPMLSSQIDWAVADRLDAAGFLVCYNKDSDKLQIKVGESAIEL